MPTQLGGAPVTGGNIHALADCTVSAAICCCCRAPRIAADIKGTSRIDAVTVYPAGAEITRIGKVKVERGEHTLLFTDLPAEAVAASIRVEGKATGKLEIGSVDTRSVSVPRIDDAVAATERRRVEEAIEKLKDDDRAR